MYNYSIGYRRLHSQHIAYPIHETARDVVRALGALQGQDYAGALWSIGLRMSEAVEADIERAIAERAIIRTWPMRGTLHFVAAEDARWMLSLMASRTIARSATRYRQLDLDEVTFARGRELLTRALEGGKSLARSEMYQTLEAGGIATDGQRGYHILGRLAQEGLICFGARDEKQETFTLLDEWVPSRGVLERDEALAELARRYFTGHGPATIADLARWSGLNLSEVRMGLEQVKSELEEISIDGQRYWQSVSAAWITDLVSELYLLPGFDEYLLGYKDRGAVLDAAHQQIIVPGGNGVFRPTIVSHGRVIGTWRRTVKKEVVVVTAEPFDGMSPRELEGFSMAAARYGEFLSLPVEVA